MKNIYIVSLSLLLPLFSLNSLAEGSDSSKENKLNPNSKKNIPANITTNIPATSEAVGNGNAGNGNTSKGDGVGGSNGVSSNVVSGGANGGTNSGVTNSVTNGDSGSANQGNKPEDENKPAKKMKCH